MTNLKHIYDDHIGTDISVRVFIICTHHFGKLNKISLILKNIVHWIMEDLEKDLITSLNCKLNSSSNNLDSY